MPQFQNRSSALQIPTHKHGIISLHPLTLGDTQLVLQLARQHLSSRQFAAQVLEHQLAIPLSQRDRIERWSDTLLAYVAITWLKRQGKDYWPPASSLTPLDAFQTSLCQGIRREQESATATITATMNGMVESAASSMRALAPAISMMESIANLIPPAQTLSHISNQLAALTRWQAAMPEAPYAAMLRRFGTDLMSVMAGPSQAEMLSHLIASMPIGPAQQIDAVARQLGAAFTDVRRIVRQMSAAMAGFQAASYRWGSIFQHLPSLDAMFEGLRQVEATVADGQSALDETGYGFATHLWSIQFVASFAYLNPRVRSAVVTNSVAARIRSPRFAITMERLVCSSSLISRRWEKIQHAITDHQRRDYVAAISIAMPEVEGLLRDLQTLRGQVRRRKSKWYIVSGGVVKVDKHGKPVAINGLRMLLDHADFGANDVMDAVIAVLKREFVDERNHTLHGERFPTERAKQSTRILLLLYVLARELREVERNIMGS